MEGQPKPLADKQQTDEVWPSLYGELELSHHYTDDRKFSDENIINRLAHYEEVEQRGELTARAMGEVALIRSLLWFEFDQRERERREHRGA